jgi:hypothetical protein
MGFTHMGQKGPQEYVVYNTNVRKKSRPLSAAAGEGSRNFLPTKAISPVTSMLAVYSGRNCIGHLFNRGKIGIEAFNSDNQSVGVFRSQHEAVAALPSSGSGL